VLQRAEGQRVWPLYILRNSEFLELGCEIWNGCVAVSVSCALLLLSCSKIHTELAKCIAITEEAQLPVASIEDSDPHRYSV
jgi:hypothetical protein